jgi:putative spermidine/putrescine transport system ATP-binding protein
MSGFLEIIAAERSFGSTKVLGGVDLAVARGEFVSLLGPSGCGKTTLLRIVAGLLSPDSGAVRLDGEEITSKPPHHRDVGVVFQNYALFPHLTVAENVAFGLEARKAPRDKIRATVSRFLDLIHMSDFADRSVRALSGGQQQRVAVARALAVQPKLLLLDEPFSALDRKLRETMQIELKRLLRELSTTAIFVTHDQDEALMMSDRIAVMNRGAIEQLADPTTIYHHPATAFVLGFVGLSTHISGTTRGANGATSAFETAVGTFEAKSSLPPGTKAFLAVRPERLRIVSEGEAGRSFNAIVRDVVFQGSKIQVHCDATGSDRIMVEASEIPQGVLTPGATVTLAFAPHDAMVFAGEPQS